MRRFILSLLGVGALAVAAIAILPSLISTIGCGRNWAGNCRLRPAVRSRSTAL